MAWSTPDISTITQSLHDMLVAAINSSSIPQFNVNVNCGSPETARTGGDCQLTLYLLHVGRDPYWRNTPVEGPRPQLNPAQPLSLNLYYLLTAWADKNFTSEQQAMSIALQCFHTQPIFRPAHTNEEFTISIEADTIEEMSRLWQAFNTPIRLSCLVKVGVVFVAPAKPVGPVAKPPVTANVAVGPAVLGGPLLYAGMNLAFAPYPPPLDGAPISVTGGELVTVGGATLAMSGAGLDQPNAAEVYLSSPDGLTEWKVTSWRQPPALPNELDLALPAAYADPGSALPAPPAAAPAPGTYRLSVGRDAPKVRSNAIPIAMAARIDSLVIPPGPLSGGEQLTLNGAGFAPGATALSLGAVALTASGVDPPPAGSFFVDPTGTSIVLSLPSSLPPPGTYPVAVVARGVPSPPGPVVTV